MRTKLIFLTTLFALLFCVPQAHAETTLASASSPDINTQFLLETSMEDNCVNSANLRSLSVLAEEESLALTCVSITELRPTGSNLLVKNHPNRFRARLSAPGAPIGDWTITASGGTITSITGGGTLAYFYVTPFNNVVAVTVTIDCGNGTSVSRTEAFSANPNGGSGGGGL